MNVIRQLTLRNLRLNRKRTIVTIIGIILSGAMICGVAALVTSFQDVFIQSAKITDGSHHATFYGVAYEDSPYISGHAETDTAMLSRDIGYAELEHSKNSPYLMIKEYDAEAFRHMPIQLKEGRYPDAPGEVVLSDSVFFSGGVEYEIGDTFTVDVGNRVDQDENVNQRPIISETETLDILTTETYTVTGIMERPRFEQNTPGYLAISYMGESELSPEDIVNISAIVKSPKHIFELAPKMADTIGINAGQISYNNELLKWMGITQSDPVNQMLYSVGLIIIILIVIGSVTVIYNAFAISVSERKKQFGMLSSVGATNRQIRKMVLHEAFTLGLIGIPLGIVAGYAGIGVTLQVVNRLMSDMMFDSEAGLRLIVTWETILITIFFLSLTILLSAYIPAKRASRISPVEAIRLNTDINVKGKHLRTMKLTRRLFGIEGELALKNLKRNRKRYRATVFSLFISIVLFVSFSSFMNYGFVSSGMYYAGIPYDYRVEKYDLPVEEKIRLYEHLASIEEVEQSAIVRQVGFEASSLQLSQLGDYLRNEVVGSEDHSAHSAIVSSDGDYRLYVELVAVGAEEFSKYVSTLGHELKDYTNVDHPKGILINWNLVDYPVYAEYAPMKVDAGENLTLTELPYEGTTHPKNLQLELGSVAEELPFGVSYTSLSGINIVVSDEVFNHMTSQLHEQSQENADYAQLFLQVQEGTDRAAFAEQIKEEDARFHPGLYLYVEDTKQNQEVLDRTRTVMSIFLYGFVSLITLIGVTNIFNTISTNVALRRREFAMLKSVGLTPAGFNKMMNYESIFYGIKSLLYGLPIGVLVSVWLYNSIGNVFQFSFMLPWKEIVICVLGVFMIVFMTMLHSSSKMKKENIIHALKDENL